MWWILIASLAWATSLPRLKVPTENIVDPIMLEGQEICPGTKAKAGSAAEAVRKYTVRVKVEGKHRCTGTMIEPEVVILAAHCFGFKEKNITIEAYGKNGYETYSVVKKTSSLSQSKDDLALFRLDRAVPAENVAPVLTGKCDSKDLVQGGFGLTEQVKAADCVRYTTYTREKPRYMPGLNLPLAVEYTFLAKPKGKLGPEQGLACNGDSGGPVYCKAGGVWTLAGVFTAVSPLPSKIKEWDEVRPICENYDRADRLEYCVKSCKLAEAVVGFDVSKALSTIDDMKAYIPPEPKGTLNPQGNAPVGEGGESGL